MKTEMIFIWVLIAVPFLTLVVLIIASYVYDKKARKMQARHHAKYFKQ